MKKGLCTIILFLVILSNFEIIISANSEGELVKFTLEDNVLIIKNMGDIRYNKTVQIIIEDNIEIKNPDLGLAEEIRYNLIASEGEHQVRVSDGTTTLIKDKVWFSPVVKTIEVLEESSSIRVGITGGILQGEDSRITIKEHLIAYIFISLILGVSLLILINRGILKKR